VLLHVAATPCRIVRLGPASCLPSHTQNKQNPIDYRKLPSSEHTNAVPNLQPPYWIMPRTFRPFAFGPVTSRPGFYVARGGNL